MTVSLTSLTRPVLTAIGRHPAPLVLELDLTEPVLEVVPPDPLGKALGRRRAALRDLVDGLRHARSDDRVVALVAKLGGDRVPLAVAQELRDAVAGLRGAGKRTVAWAESFGELSSGTVSYYLAAGFDEVWLQPSGDLALTGFAAEVPFLREALDKAGVVTEIGQRYEYKNAANVFTERGFTPAHREASARLVASAADQVVAGVAAGRRLDPAQVRALVDRAPLLAQEAHAAGLVDRIGYRDEVYADVRAAAGERAELRFLSRYAKDVARAPRRRLVARSRPVLGLVQGTGVVKVGRSGRAPLPIGGPSMGSDTVCAALRAAARDEDVRAVVLRVDSPGGSYVASDSIWRQVGQVKAAGKPVVVSMGAVAASGGYFVAAPADAIVASPGTITGSIGVFAGKQVVSGLLGRLGVSVDSVAEGEHALLSSARRSYSPDERDLIERWLDAVYADFTGKVAAGRGLTRDRVHEIARGRVWTGEDAHARGLVDELGGLERAVEIACQRAGLPAGTEPTLRTYPKSNPLARIKPAESSEDPAAASSGSGLAGYLDGWGSMASIAAQLGLPAAGPLLLPGPWVL